MPQIPAVIETQRPSVDSSFEQQSCPVCNNPKASYEPRVASRPRAETMRFEELKPYWHGFFKDKVFFSYYRCHGCGTLYCREYFTGPQLDQLYHQMPDNTAGVPLEPLSKTQKGYFQLLKKFSPLRGDYLEVGPDIGLFTGYCVKEGAFDRYWLFEPNTGVRSSLEKVLAGKACHIIPKFLDFDQLPDHQMSTVVMVHVLDHLTDPKSLLLAMKKKLSPRAILLFVVHDESSLLARLTRTKWPPYCLQHPLLFNPKTFSKLMESTGYRVLAVRKSSNYYPLTYLAKHLLWAAGLKKVALPSWNFLTLPFKLGNLMAVCESTV